MDAAEEEQGAVSAAFAGGRAPDTVQLSPHVRRSDGVSGFQRVQGHLGQRMDRIEQFYRVFSVLAVRPDAEKYAGHQSAEHCDPVPAADHAGAAVQPDEGCQVQKVFSGLHLSAAFHLDGGHVWHDHPVHISDQRDHRTSVGLYRRRVPQCDGLDRGVPMAVCADGRVAESRLGQHPLCCVSVRR